MTSRGGLGGASERVADADGKIESGDGAWERVAVAYGEIESGGRLRALTSAGWGLSKRKRTPYHS